MKMHHSSVDSISRLLHEKYKLSAQTATYIGFLLFSTNRDEITINGVKYSASN